MAAAGDSQTTPMQPASDSAPQFKNLHTREYLGHKKKVHSVAWNCTGTKLASGSVDQTARVWSIEPHGHTKAKDIELKGHSDSVDQLCWDPKHADLVATASGDKTVRLWDARSGKCSQQVELSGENINITFKPDGTLIAVGNRDDELTIIDVRKFKPIHKRKFSYEVNEIAWNTTGELFFLTTGNGTVEVLAYPSLQALHTLIAHTAGCYCIAIDPTGRYFAVGSADALVSLWDLSEMLCVRTFTKLEFTPDLLDKYDSLNPRPRDACESNIDYFKRESIKELKTGRSDWPCLPGQKFYVLIGSEIVGCFATAAKTVLALNCLKAASQSVENQHSCYKRWPVRTISFNHDGQYIASASEDLFIDIAEVQTGRTVHQIPCRAAMNSVEWNPKYNLLAFAGDDKNKYQADEGVFRVFGFETQ